MNVLLLKADAAGLVKVTLFSANDMKKSAKKFQFILDISPLDYVSVSIPSLPAFGQQKSRDDSPYISGVHNFYEPASFLLLFPALLKTGLIKGRFLF